MSGPSFVEIAAMLREDPGLVVDRYCSSDGAYRDAQGRLFCLNPMRADRSVGSFYVNMTGPSKGRWHDHSTGESGDLMDLIRSVDHCDTYGAVQTAKQLLGLIDMTPARRQQLDAARRERARRTEIERAKRSQYIEKREGWARALYHSAEPAIAGTPVARYLKGRGINIHDLPRMPGAIRYHPKCRYGERVDDETGEVLEVFYPAMIGAIVDRQNQIIGAHRTFLEAHHDGTVTKAPVPDPKKVLGSKQGACIRLWSGFGPKGGKGASLSRCPPETRVYVTEGIEDGLSLVLLRPQSRVLVAITLENMVKLALPRNVSEVVLVADNDEGKQAKAQLDQAIDAHSRAGRTVRVWRNQWGGKDLNDLINPGQNTGEAGHAA